MMNFKKDYINYVLQSVLQSEFYGVRDDNRVRKVLENIISIQDTAEATYLTGKTAGLEMLFKYLLYISDKIDKSQITIFNIKNNYDYDLQNLKKICEEIKNYKTTSAKKETVAEVTEEAGEPETTQESESFEIIEEQAADDVVSAEVPETVKQDSDKGETETVEAGSELDDSAKSSDEQSEFTLIENEEKEGADDEVFGLDGISRSVNLDVQESSEQQLTEERAGQEEYEHETESLSEADIIKENKADEFQKEEIEKALEYEHENVSSSGSETNESEAENVSLNEEKEDFEFEIKKEYSEELHSEVRDGARDDSVASEVYYKFENIFFEDVKILEKLFTNISRQCKGKSLDKIGRKTLQSFTEIIEISSELADLTRQLEFDLTADIFLTINLLFTRAIKTPSLIFPGRIKDLKSVLGLVSSLIKGEDYLGHDEVISKIEELKEVLKKPSENAQKESKPAEITAEETKKELPMKKPEEPGKKQEHIKTEAGEKDTEKELDIRKETKGKAKVQDESKVKSKEKGEVKEEKSKRKEIPAVKEKSKSPETQEDTSGFKMKYLVKEFEKLFLNLGNIEGEYSKYEILEAVDEMNELLRMLAKISASVKNADVLKLSEVSYVFLKYLKDYKMDLLDKEIQQIIKYIIFTYKMLLTNRKPEDFEILVQYLNNPVKIFTDT